MILVRGAYGRTYSTESKAQHDWQEGLDFYIVPSQGYCSIRDFDELDTVYCTKDYSLPEDLILLQMGYAI